MRVLIVEDEPSLGQQLKNTLEGAGYAIDLARPRNLIDIKAESRFHHLYRDIWTDLRQEVLKSYERSR